MLGKKTEGDSGHISSSLMMVAPKNENSGSDGITLKTNLLPVDRLIILFVKLVTFLPYKSLELLLYNDSR